MTNTASHSRLFTLLNVVELLSIVFVLTMAMVLQIRLHELPCPLCLLQRAGLLGICVGLLLNIRFQPRPVHYTLVLLSAVFSACVALRHIALHVVPGTGAYGSPVFDFHLYTWVFIISMIVITYTAIILGCSAQYQAQPSTNHCCWKKGITHLCFLLVFATALANTVSTYLECGFKECPENPVVYLKLNG